MADARTAATVQRLEAAFRAVASARMAGVPLLNPRLRVQAVGFAPWPDEPAVALGVLMTPWFMNLLRVPLDADAARLLPLGRRGTRQLGGHAIEFIGAHEPAFGAYEMCSLFSPMFEFADHDAAIATAREVLALLRADGAPPVKPVPARRGFLFGRSAAARTA